MQAIHLLDYRPNEVARALVRRRTKTVGMIIPDVANLFFAELMRGSEDTLDEGEFAVIFGNSDNDATHISRYAASFRERQVDGLLLVVGGDPDGDLGGLVDQCPTVAVDRVPENWGGHCVVADASDGMHQAVSHLAALNHTRIAFINGESGISTADERRQAFLKAVAQHGLAPVAVSDGTFTIESGREQFRAVLDAHPTAICAGNDLLAFGAIQAAAERGIRVPADVSIVGFDDIAYAELLSPTLTTVRQRPYEMGAHAARILLDLMSRKKVPDRRHVVPVELQVRQSTGLVGSAP